MPERRQNLLRQPEGRQIYFGTDTPKSIAIMVDCREPLRCFD